MMSHTFLMGLPGRTWKAFAETEQLNDFKVELGRLSIKLNGVVTVHMARTVEVVSGGGRTYSYYRF